MTQRLRFKSKHSKKPILMFAIFTLAVLMVSIISQSIVLSNSANSFSQNKNVLSIIEDVDQLSSQINSNIQPLSSDETAVNELNENGFNPVGSIEMNNLLIMGVGFPFFSYQPLNIKYTFVKWAFLGTEIPFSTITSELDEITGERSGDIWIKLNETIRFDYYYNATEWLVGWRPHLERWNGTELWLNGTQIAEENFISNSSGMFYNFSQQFIANENGTLIIDFLYDAAIGIKAAKVISNTQTIPDTILTEESTELSRSFVYNITIEEKGFNPNNPEIPRDLNITGDLSFYIPDYNEIYDLKVYKNLSLSVNNTDNFKQTGNTFIHRFNVNDSLSFSATFKADFTIEIIEAGSGFWFKDSLIEGLSIRKRDYKITVVDGPSTLLLRHFWINETTIPYPDLHTRSDNVYSALGRPIAVRNMNTSVPYDPTIVRVEDEEEQEYVDGISFIGRDATNSYYIAMGEVDVISVVYVAKYSLSMVITDRISTPLSGYSVIVNYQGLRYGSIIAQSNNVVYPTLITDRNGQISMNYVPYGNFSLDVFDPQGNLIGTYNASSLMPNNIVITDVQHFPITEIVFAVAAIVMIVSGIRIFNKRDAL